MILIEYFFINNGIIRYIITKIFYFKGDFIMYGVSIIAILYIILIVSILGLGIYTLLLAIKALKIYIKNNS